MAKQPFIPIEHCVQATLQFTYAGQQARNVCYFTGMTDGTDPEPGAVAIGVYNWWNVNLRPIVPTTVTLDAIATRDMSVQTNPVFLLTAGLPLVGTGSSSSLPNNVTLAMSFRTSLSGRSYRGRMYHVGLSSTLVTSNEYSTTHRAALLAAYDLLRVIKTTGGDNIARLCVASRYQNLQPRAVGIVNPVVAVTSDWRLDSQRRRLPGRGR
jgi:hypothetical protein